MPHKIIQQIDQAVDSHVPSGSSIWKEKLLSLWGRNQSSLHEKLEPLVKSLAEAVGGLDQIDPQVLSRWEIVIHKILKYILDHGSLSTVLQGVLGNNHIQDFVDDNDPLDLDKLHDYIKRLFYTNETIDMSKIVDDHRADRAMLDYLLVMREKLQEIPKHTTLESVDDHDQQPTDSLPYALVQSVSTEYWTAYQTTITTMPLAEPTKTAYRELLMEVGRTVFVVKEKNEAPQTAHDICLVAVGSRIFPCFDIKDRQRYEEIPKSNTLYYQYWWGSEANPFDQRKETTVAREKRRILEQYAYRRTDNEGLFPWLLWLGVLISIIQQQNPPSKIRAIVDSFSPSSSYPVPFRALLSAVQAGKWFDAERIIEGLLMLSNPIAETKKIIQEMVDKIATTPHRSVSVKRALRPYDGLFADLHIDRTRFDQGADTLEQTLLSVQESMKEMIMQKKVFSTEELLRCSPNDPEIWSVVLQGLIDDGLAQYSDSSKKIVVVKELSPADASAKQPSPDRLTREELNSYQKTTKNALLEQASRILANGTLTAGMFGLVTGMCFPAVLVKSKEDRPLSAHDVYLVKHSDDSGYSLYFRKGDDFERIADTDPVSLQLHGWSGRSLLGRQWGQPARLLQHRIEQKRRIDAIRDDAELMHNVFAIGALYELCFGKEWVQLGWSEKPRYQVMRLEKNKKPLRMLWNAVCKAWWTTDNPVLDSDAMLDALARVDKKDFADACDQEIEYLMVFYVWEDDSRKTIVKDRMPDLYAKHLWWEDVWEDVWQGEDWWIVTEDWHAETVTPEGSGDALVLSLIPDGDESIGAIELFWKYKERLWTWEKVDVKSFAQMLSWLQNKRKIVISTNPLNNKDPLVQKTSSKQA